QSIGGQDVSLLAIDVVQQGDAGTAVRVVLDRIDAGRHAILVATEINQTVLLLVPTTTMPGRDLALIVAATGLHLGAQQALLGPIARRELGEITDRGAAAPGSGRLVSS